MARGLSGGDDPVSSRPGAEPPGDAGPHRRMIDAGIHGLIMLGTVGENCSLEYPEKLEVLRATVDHVAGRIPVLTGVAECTTARACKFAADAQRIGVDGLMVLPAMVYKSDPRETIAHYPHGRAGDRPADHGLQQPGFVRRGHHARDVRRAGRRAEAGRDQGIVGERPADHRPRRMLCGDRYMLFCGVDDLVLESLLLGATGLGLGPGQRLPGREPAAVGPGPRRTVGRGARGLSLVHAAAPPGYPREAGAVHQARRSRNAGSAPRWSGRRG